MYSNNCFRFFTITICAIILFFFGVSCKSQIAALEVPVKQLIIDREMLPADVKKDIEIEKVSFVDSIVIIEIQSFPSQTYDLVFSGAYAKSLPLQATLFLKETSLDRMQDNGQTKQKKVLKFNVAALIHTPNAEIHFKIHPFPEKFILNPQR